MTFRNTAYFLEREFFVGISDFIDFKRVILASDSLPTNTLCILTCADRVCLDTRDRL